MSYTQKILYSSIFLFVSSLFVSFLGYYHRYLLSQKLSVSDFGLFYVVIGFFGVLGIFTSFGIDGAIYKYTTEYYVSKENKKINFLITFSILFKLFFSLILIFILYINQNFIITNYFKDSRIEYFFYIMYFIILLGPFYSIIPILLSSFMKFKYIAIINVLYWCLVVFLTYISDGINNMLISYFLPSILIWLIIGIILLFILKYKPIFTLDLNTIKEYIKYSIPIFLSGLAFNILGYQDIALLKIFTTNNDIGIYSMGMAIANIIWSLSGSFVSVLFPYFIEIKNKDESLFIDGIRKIFKYTAIIFMPFIFLFFIFGNLFIDLLFGQQYIQATRILQILVLGALFVIFFNILNTIINSILHPSYIIKYIYLSISIGIILNIIFIRYYGIIIAAIVFVLIYFLLFIFSYNIVKKSLNIHFKFKYIVILLFINFINSIFIYYLNNTLIFNTYIKAIILFIIYYIIYIFLLFITNLLTKKEIQEFYKSIIIKNKIFI